MPQKVDFIPKTDISESKIGAGRKVALEILDERDGQLLGRRTSASGLAGAIESNQDMTMLFTKEIEKGLEKKNFIVVPKSDNEKRKLRIEIRSIQYQSWAGFWTISSTGKTTLKAIAQNDQEVYENIYRIDGRQAHTLLVPAASTNSEILNEVVSNALTELFKDNKLISFLADGEQITTTESSKTSNNTNPINK